jgi:hypothetical protein
MEVVRSAHRGRGERLYGEDAASGRRLDEKFVPEKGPAAARRT